MKPEVQSLLNNMCLYGVCSLILTKPNTNQNIGVRLRKATHYHPVYINKVTQFTPTKHTFSGAHIVDGNLPSLCLLHGLHMGIHKVGDMDVVTYACAIGRVVVQPPHL